MPEHPLKTIEKLDPKLARLIEDTQELALSDGALPKKFKILIAMSLDAAHGVNDGVNSLARAAMQSGATKEEITEALRVVQFVCGVVRVFPASQALSGLF